MENFYTTLPSPLGEIVITSDGAAITGLYLPGNSGYKTAKAGTNNPKLFKQAAGQLKEYFTGKRTGFDLSLAPKATEFQKQVWAALRKIPHGKTTSYGALAKKLGKPTASRAIGNANGKNPICIIIPCHRVIAANGKLGGYNGGLKAKEWLLAHEAG